MTTYVVNDSTQLNELFDTLKGGDRVELAPGSYRWVTLRSMSFDEEVIITSQDPNNPVEITKQLTVDHVHNLRIENVNLVADSIAPKDYYTRAHITNSSNIAFENMEIRGFIPTAETGGLDPDDNPPRRGAIDGFGYENGMVVRASEGVTLDGLSFSDLYLGLHMEWVKNSTVTNSDLYNLREGINILNLTNVEISHSHFHDFIVYKGDHTDMIQFWGTTASGGIHGLTIKDNLFRQPTDMAHQTIYGYVDPDVIVAVDFVVSGNTIMNSHPNAIRLGGISGGIVEDNIVLPGGADTDWAYYPTILLPDASNVLVRNNIVVEDWDGSLGGLNSQIQADRNITLDGNTLLSRDSGVPLAWRDLLPYFDQLEADDVEKLRQILNDLGNDQAEIPSDYASTVFGTDGNDILWATANDTKIVGGSGHDKIYERGGSDWLEGGASYDFFFFDFGRAGAQHDIVADLNFNQGDILSLSGGGWTFTNDADPSNWLTLVNGGEVAIIKDNSDLAEVIAQGAFDYAEGTAGDSLLLIPTVAPDRVVEILGLTWQELGLPEPLSDATPVEREYTLLSGTDGNDILWATANDTKIVGGGGHDKIYERGGSDWLEGGASYDFFFFDFGRAGAQHDIVADLNFNQGDILSLSGGGWTFTNDADPSNWLTLVNGGEVAIIKDNSDLAEVIAQGAFDYAEGTAGDSLLLIPTVAPDRVVEILGLTWQELGLPPDDLVFI